MRTWFLVVAFALVGTSAQARNVEPGTLWVTGGPASA